MSLNSGGAHNDEWRVVFADVTADSADYQTTTNQQISHYKSNTEDLTGICLEIKDCLGVSHDDSNANPNISQWIAVFKTGFSSTCGSSFESK